MRRLLYVIGASGSGKDSVIDFSRQRLRAADQCLFAHRYITRPAAAGGENHVALSDWEFACRLQAGLFSMNWDSHGYRYAIGREIEVWLGAGCNVVVNGSRGYLPEAARRFPQLVPVLITVPREVLQRRLHARRRESAKEIEERLEKSEAYRVEHPRLVTLSNDGPLEQAGGRFLELARSGEVETAAARQG